MKKIAILLLMAVAIVWLLSLISCHKTSNPDLTRQDQNFKQEMKPLLTRDSSLKVAITKADQHIKHAKAHADSSKAKVTEDLKLVQDTVLKEDINEAFKSDSATEKELESKIMLKNSLVENKLLEIRALTNYADTLHADVVVLDKVVEKDAVKLKRKNRVIEVLTVVVIALTAALLIK